jgi:hypothetical protein
VPSASWDPATVRHVLGEHATYFEELLGVLHRSVGGKRMATLGFEYGRRADTAFTRLLD